MYSHEQYNWVKRTDGCERRIRISLTHCEKMLGVVTANVVCAL